MPTTQRTSPTNAGPAARAVLLGLLVAGLIAVLLTATADPTLAQDETVTVPNQVQFTDTSGRPVHAHGGGMLRIDDYYYWFGEYRNPDNTFSSVAAYRSTDLRNWEFRNHVLTQSSDPELRIANIERPKVIYNESTGRFVMWMHKENGRDYSEARAAVAVSDTVDGDYTWLGSLRPLGHMSRDITAFVDPADGAGYMISAANENADLHIYRLTPDYTGIDDLVQILWPGNWREAPAMFERDGVYFLLTSGATGWDPNQQKYATASSPEGPWSGLSDVGSEYAYDSQTAFVLPVQGTEETSYLYLGDRWGGSFQSTVMDSRYVWLPLEFPTPTTMRMDWADEVRINTTTGEVSGVTVPAPPGEYPIENVTVGGEESWNPAPSAIDGDLLTRWASDGDLSHAWIRFGLDRSRPVGAIRLMLARGGIRHYPLRIEAGDSPTALREVWSGDTPYNSGFETISFEPMNARYVQVTMTGTNTGGSSYLSLFEAGLYSAGLRR